MNRIFRWLIVSVIVLISMVIGLCQPIQSALTMPVETSPVQVAQNLDFDKHFRDLGIEGSILIEDANSTRYQHNPQRNLTPFLPASTYKILNSLISLETGVITDEVAVLTWDGITRMLPEWNRDLNMREAFKLSAVWFYQVLARRVGHERMQKWVTQVGYGNQKIGSKEDIDKFWLEGELRITPSEQIQFLRRLYNSDLPFSKRSLSIVKDIMIIEKTPDYTLRVKSGWAGLGSKTLPQIGWMVGYLEKGKNAYFFATNIDIRNDADGPKRLEVTRRCFKDLGVL